MRKAYVKPVVTRIELNYQQAVLASCTRTTTNVRTRTGTNCVRNRCRRGTGTAESGASS